MTCPCGRFDYVDSTSSTLGEAMARRGHENLHTECVQLISLSLSLFRWDRSSRTWQSGHPSVFDWNCRLLWITHRSRRERVRNTSIVSIGRFIMTFFLHVRLRRREIAKQMRHYQHSARCPSALRTFLAYNPNYWPFIPLLRDEALGEDAIDFRTTTS